MLTPYSLTGALLCLVCICLAPLPCCLHWFEQTNWYCTGCGKQVATRNPESPVHVLPPPHALSVPSQYAAQGQQPPPQVNPQAGSPPPQGQPQQPWPQQSPPPQGQQQQPYPGTPGSPPVPAEHQQHASPQIAQAQHQQQQYGQQPYGQPPYGQPEIMAAPQQPYGQPQYGSPEQLPTKN